MPTSLARTTIASLLLAAACSAGGSITSCPDAECRTATVLSAFVAEPEETSRAIARLESVEQEALVRVLAQAEPEDLRGLCRSLQVGSAGHAACERMRERPHLRLGAQARVQTSHAPRQAPGPTSRHPPLPTVLPPTEEERTAAREALAACSAGEDCVHALAMAAGQEGRAQRAGALCLEGYPGQDAARGECSFRAAEAMAGAFRWRAAQQVMALCAWSGSFAHGCVQHCLAAMLPDLPHADRAGPEDLEASRPALEALEDAVGPALAPTYADLFWALWVAQAFLHAERIDGRLLRVLPAEAEPHVRAAAAWQFLERRPPGAPDDLEAWAADLTARLADPGVAVQGDHFRPRHDKQRDFWPEDLARGGEGAIPAAYCLGPGRRPVAADPGLDLRLALLEASGRTSHPPPSSFYQTIAAGDGDLLLRWTALRILGAADPEPALAFDRPGLPALLRARATRPPAER